MLNSPTALPFQIVSTPVHSSSPQLACPRTEKETIMPENLYSSILIKTCRSGEQRGESRQEERGEEERGEWGGGGHREAS